jgi:hypothetical protein
MATLRTTQKDDSKLSNPSERFLTRSEAADLLGISVHSILDHERIGRITAHWTIVPDASGRLRDTPLLKVDDVLKLPRRKKSIRPTPDDPDELCARAFELFEKGQTPKQVVIELRATIQKIDALHTEWLDHEGATLTLSETIKAELVTLLGNFEDAGELVALVRKRCAL